MPLKFIDDDISRLVQHWHNASFPKQPRVTEVNPAGINACSKNAKGYANMLGAVNSVEKNYDAYKLAAAYSYAVAEEAAIIKFSLPRGTSVDIKDKHALRQDCALDVYLSMLQTNRSDVLADAHIGQLIKDMFHELVAKKHPTDGPRLALLRSLAILAYTLERTHPLLSAS